MAAYDTDGVSKGPESSGVQTYYDLEFEEHILYSPAPTGTGSQILLIA